MLKFFEDAYSCKIFLKPPLVNQDYDCLRELLKKTYDSWIIDFGFIEIIEEILVSILYEEMIENKKIIEIITHRYKLNRYLNKLGFQVILHQFMHRSALDIDKIEVVLIGGSADSSPKIIEIVKNVALYDLSLVIIQHVEEEVIGRFDEILQKYTNHKVAYARDGELLQKGAIYLVPNNKHLKVNNGYFKLCNAPKYNFARPSISISYESFSLSYKNKLLIIQECGYASDGVDKLEFAIKNGSKVLIQDKTECKAKSMVISAYENNFYNYILNTKNIIFYFKLLEKKFDNVDFLDTLLDMIFEKYGYDFRLYHKDMLKRRLSVFMLKHSIKNIKDVMEIILFGKEMFREFVSEVSINVTELFRNPKFFYKLLEFFDINFKKTRNIKIWSAGCSSGEEVYSIAILLKKINLLSKSIIYATDFNKIILQEAENAIYSKESYALAKENFKEIDYSDSLDNYMRKNNSYVLMNEEIREKVLFFQHNLAIDSSFNEFDTIICKNVMIYFDDRLKRRVFELFYNSLKFGGFLIIGEKEHIHETFKNKFKIYNLKYKIFRKVV